MAHKIISLSVTEKFSHEIEKLQKDLGFSGRSELIRTGLKMLIADRKQKQELTGKINAVLIVVHAEKNELEVMKYKHLFNQIIKTHVHTNMEKACMDLFTLEGDSTEIKDLADSIQKIKDIDYVKLIVS